ncbi:MAG: kelch repeat-containing protein [Candidatus Saccharibacteria bacterium]|nr:kelch repeat-containing protein [Candidatus Saccharibacteria bacterium]
MANNSWSTGTAGGTARRLHTSVLYNGRIYSGGGIDSVGAIINTVDIYDIANDSWSTGTAGGTTRRSHDSVLYNGKMYLWGGWNGSSYLNTVDIYDIANNSWSTGTAGGTARYNHTSVLYNGKIYSWGGNNGSDLNTVDIYDIATNSWSTGTAGGTARYIHTSVLYNSKIYSWGGYGGGALNTVDIYDIGFKQSILALQENGQDTLSFQTGSQLFLSSGRMGIMGGNVGIGTSTPTSTFEVTHAVGSSVTGKALAVFNQTENQDIFTASSSGTTRFTIGNTGNVEIGTVDAPGNFAIGAPKVRIYSTLGTSPAASISAVTSGTALMITNDGSGDLLSASSSGLRKFWISSDGSVNYTGDLNGVAGDFAEYFKKADRNEQFEAGQLVCTGSSGVTKCTDGAKMGLIGVVSDNALIKGGGFHEDDPTYVLVGMVGQLGVKVNGNVMKGDALTFSSTPGYATVARSEAEIIGYALDNSIVGEDRVATVIQPRHYNPNTALQKEGVFNGLTIAFNNGIYIVRDSFGNTLNNVNAFSKAVIGNLTAGFINAQKIAVNAFEATTSSLGNATASTLAVATDSITIGGQNIRDFIIQTVANAGFTNQPISPLAEAPEIKTNVISPLADTSAPSISFENSKLKIKNSTETVAWFDNTGNATFSGELTARKINTDNIQVADASISGTLAANTVTTQQLNNAGDASVGGTLHANNIIANNISGLDDKISSIAGNLIASNYNGVINADMINAQFGIFEQGITAMGPITSPILTATDQLAVGSSFTITNNAINTIGTDLEIQSLRQGNIAFQGSLIKMDTDGNMQIAGNLNVMGEIDAVFGVFSGSLTTKALATSMISPLPGDDLIIKLSDGPSTPSGKLKVQNSQGQEVLSVNSQGDITASGAATLAKLNFNLVGQAIATSLSEAVATGSAGFATLRAGQPELTIKNPNVTSKSLIYITPFGDNGNKVLYLLRQVPHSETEDGSFTVGLSGTATQNIQFNWLVVN